MKLRKFEKLIFISIILILIQLFNNNVYAENNNEEFRFEQSIYILRGEHDNRHINMILPKGYTINDVEFISEDENIVHIIKFWEDYYCIESLNMGETKIKARIKSTNYVTYCDVKVEDAIIINVLEKDVGVTLEIDNYCPYYWSRATEQACEISISKLDSNEEEKWIQLGKGIYSEALNKKYYYDINENCVVSVRWISWWNEGFYDGEYEIYKKSIVIDNIEPVYSIGAHIDIYREDAYSINNYSEINLGDTLKLNVKLIEIPDTAIIEWKSYQENVLMINSEGIVTTVGGDGPARIEATATIVSDNGYTNVYKDVYTIIVNSMRINTNNLLEKSGAVCGIIPDKIDVNDIKQAVICGDNLNISWNSSDNEIVQIDKNGLIKGISKGKATINANILHNNNSYNIEQEVVVDGEKVENEHNENKKDEENKSDNTNKKQIKEEDEINNTNIKNRTLQNDKTVAKGVIPQTGDNSRVMLVGIICTILIIIVLYVKYKKINW